MDIAYKTPLQKCVASLLVKKSEFIAQLAPAQCVQEAQNFLAAVRAAHHSAAHNVYAYVLHSPPQQRSSDDGEPNKTAGPPVLAAIQQAGLSNCVLVVTRYFGGVLLGGGGLVRAYGAAAKAAIAAGEIAGAAAVKNVSCCLEYTSYNAACNILKKAKANIQPPIFAQQVKLVAALPAAQAPAVQKQLCQLLRSKGNVHMGEEYYVLV